MSSRASASARGQRPWRTSTGRCAREPAVGLSRAAARSTRWSRRTASTSPGSLRRCWAPLRLPRHLPLVGDTHEEILPRIRAEVPAARVLIVGASPPKGLCAAFPGVSATGYVPDVRPYLERAQAVGTPAVVLVGPTSPWELAMFDGGTVVHAPGVECLACYRADCDKPVTCVERLEPEQVLAAAEPWPGVDRSGIGSTLHPGSRAHLLATGQ